MAGATRKIWCAVPFILKNIVWTWYQRVIRQECKQPDLVWRLTPENKIWNFALVIILSPIQYPSLVSLSISRHFINEALCKLFDLVSCSLQYHFHLNSGVFLNALLSYTGFHKIHRHTFVVHDQKCLWFADCGHLVPVLSPQIFYIIEN